MAMKLPYTVGTENNGILTARVHEMTDSCEMTVLTIH